MKKRKLILASLLLIIGVGFSLIDSNKTSAIPQTFEVNSIGDAPDANTADGTCETATSGECTLVAAIQQANSNGNPSEQDLITFNIFPKNGTPKTIVSDGSTYEITQNVKIDGFSQLDGATENTQAAPAPLDSVLRIELDVNGGLSGGGIVVINTEGVEITGLVVNNTKHTQEAISVINSSGVKVRGNYINTSVDGMTSLHQGGSGIGISGSDNIVGGSDPADRNIITAGDQGGVQVIGSTLDPVENTTIKGNNIFVAKDSVTSLPPDGTWPFNLGSGITAYNVDGLNIGGDIAGEGNIIENANSGDPSLSNAHGIHLDGQNTNTVNNVSILGNRIVGNDRGITLRGSGVSNVSIGSSDSDGRNIISDSKTTGVLIQEGANNISITNNGIGVASDGTSALGNGTDGISIMDGSTGIAIGGIGVNEGNIIANNNRGVVLGGNSNNSVSILRNSVYGNNGLGIDLAGDGVTLNDPLDSDPGQNTLLNFPVLYEPIENVSDTDIPFDYDLPAGSYRIEFFSNTSPDASGYGEGEEFIGSDSFISNGGGITAGISTVTGTGHTNIRATVTLEDSGNYIATSEFSGPIVYPDKNVSVSKSVVDQGTIASDGTVAYTVTYTNTGVDDLDISELVFNNSDPLNTALFNDIFPSNLTFSSVNGDADCSEQNAASSFGSLFDSHSDYTVLSCEYNGVSPRVLSQGDDITFTLNFTVADRTESGMTNYVLSVPTAYDADLNDYQDAVDTGDDIIDELGSSINNLSSATTSLISDISISKQLLTDSADVEAGGTLSYQLTYTNNGDDPAYIAGNTPLASQPLFYDYVNPDLSIVSADVAAVDDPFPGVNTLNVGDPDILCFEGTAGTATLLGLTTYGGYGFVVCWYVGSDLSLASGADIAVTLNFDVADESELDFANYAFAYPNIGGSLDPDANTIDDAIAAGDDVLDGLIKSLPNTEINNFAVSTLPIDVNVTSQVIDPPVSISEGTPIKLKVNLQNNGPASFRFSDYPSFVSAVVSTIFSGNDLTFDGVEGNLLSCTNLGTGGAAFLGTAGEDHPGLENITCVGSGSDIVVAPGDSQDITLLFSAKSTVTSSFSFYSINAAATSDPDIPGLFGAIFGASEDVLDTIENNNYARSNYTGTVVVNPGGTPGGNGGQNGSNGGLSSTGQDILMLIALGSILVLVAVAIYKKTHTQKTV
jgi:hypothetical protein